MIQITKENLDYYKELKEGLIYILKFKVDFESLQIDTEKNK